MSGQVKELIDRWRLAGVGLQADATEEEIGILETLLGARLPDDVRALYALANGMQDFDHDGWLVSLWSVQRILAERELSTGSDERGPFTQVALQT